MFSILGYNLSTTGNTIEMTLHIEPLIYVLKYEYKISLIFVDFFRKLSYCFDRVIHIISI